MSKKLNNIVSGLEMLLEDSSVPRNIRSSAENVKTLLQNGDEPLDVRKAQAINLLDEAANDPNIPMHGRTVIWQILSSLESLKA